MEKLEMAGKTPVKVKALIEQHSKAMRNISAILSAKEEGQESSLHSEYSAEYYEGLAVGQSIMLESVLFEHNCYHGFVYVDANKKPVKVGEEGYAEWRRIYYAK